MANFWIKITTACAIISLASCGTFYPKKEEAVGYSYATFSGPVSGPEHKIQVPDKNGKGYSIDYVAQPDYTFTYGVEDPKSKVSQSRKEVRKGDAVTGEYSVVEPDGTLRTVKYTADKKNGYQVQMYKNGKLEEAGGAQIQHHVPVAAPAPAPAPAPVHHQAAPSKEETSESDDDEGGDDHDGGDDDDDEGGDDHDDDDDEGGDDDDDHEEGGDDDDESDEDDKEY